MEQADAPQHPLPGLRYKDEVLPLVVVEWVDSAMGHDWSPLTDMLQAERLAPGYSVGWLLQETPTFITIVPHVMGGVFSQEPMDGDGDMMIPRGCVVAVHRLTTCEPYQYTREAQPPSKGAAT